MFCRFKHHPLRRQLSMVSIQIEKISCISEASSIFVYPFGGSINEAPRLAIFWLVRHLCDHEARHPVYREAVRRSCVS
jgi:hypothetical protein